MGTRSPAWCGRIVRAKLAKSVIGWSSKRTTTSSRCNPAAWAPKPSTSPPIQRPVVTGTPKFGRPLGIQVAAAAEAEHRAAGDPQGNPGFQHRLEIFQRGFPAGGQDGFVGRRAIIRPSTVTVTAVPPPIGARATVTVTGGSPGLYR